MKNSIKYIILAILAALFYAINIPVSKILLNDIGSTLLAGLLYLGAGLGIGMTYFLKRKKISKADRLSKKDLPYVILMVMLDILAPILLMYGLKNTTAGNASLLNNFEIVATTLIALTFFKEKISFKMWIAVILITISSIIISVDDLSSFTFSAGSLFVLLAATCWGLENNCTRMISNKSTYQIVTIKGLCCGIGSIIIGLILGENVSNIWNIVIALILGFVAYGLSIFCYIKSQSGIGASKTSSFYAVNPFLAAILSFIILKEPLTLNFGIGLIIMLIGTIIIIIDILNVKKTES